MNDLCHDSIGNKLFGFIFSRSHEPIVIGVCGMRLADQDHRIVTEPIASGSFLESGPDVRHMFYRKFHLPRPILYSPSSKCTCIGALASSNLFYFEALTYAFLCYVGYLDIQKGTNHSKEVCLKGFVIRIPRGFCW